ncbi:MAG: trypsin-like peptidase domain-containing protein [Alphaproteobacteria bacterium]|nr:trypsin-like peptidase domain-containing protein [Alphaproteobacteria bacterium]
MNFIRLLVYVGAILGTVGAWENVRSGVFDFLNKKDVEKEQGRLQAKEQEQDIDEQVTKQQGPYVGSENVDDRVANIKNEPIIKTADDIEISFSKGFSDVARKAMHSVVNVATMQLIEEDHMDLSDLFHGPFDDFFKDFFDAPKKKSRTRKATALGSGFIVRIDGDTVYIATNHHVIEKAKKVVVYLSDKTELPAEVHASDPRTDVAVLSVNVKDLKFDKSKMQAIEWGDSSQLEEGNFVIAIGNPFGLGSTVTHGIVSSKGRNVALGKSPTSFIEDYIQHSAPINMGNSGGCLLDVTGKVIGINNAIFSTSGGNIGIGFAIPSNIAKTTVEQLIKHKRTFRGWFGAEVHHVDAKLAESVGLTEHTLDSSKIFGAYIAKLVPNGPAEKAGIKVGDIVIEFNGKKISEKCTLQMAVGTAEIGKTAKAKVWRQDGKDWGEVEVQVAVGDYEEAMKNGDIDSSSDEGTTSSGSKSEVEVPELGITLSKVPEKHRSEYPAEVSVIVRTVDEDRSMSWFGPLFMPGDGIISANNEAVKTPAQFKSIIEKIGKNEKLKNRPIPFQIVRGQSRMLISTNIDFSESKEKNKEEKNSDKGNKK